MEEDVYASLGAYNDSGGEDWTSSEHLVLWEEEEQQQQQQSGANASSWWHASVSQSVSRSAKLINNNIDT